MRLSIKGKLMAIVAVMLSLAIFAGAMGIYGMTVANGSLRESHEKQLASVVLVNRAATAVGSVRLNLDRALLHPDADDVPRLMKRTEQLLAESDAAWEAYRKLPLFPGEEELAKEVSESREKLMRATLLPLIKALGNHDREATEVMEKAVVSPFHAYRVASDKLAEFQERAAESAFGAATRRLEQMIYLSLGGLAFGVCCSVYCLSMLRRSIANPLSIAVCHVKSIGTGDLRSPIDFTSRDEIGSLMDALRFMQASLADTVAGVRNGADSVALATAEIADGNTDLSERTQSQAASIERTAAAVEEITASLEQTSENTALAGKLVTEAVILAEANGKAFDKITENMLAIDKSATRITEIITVIEGIAFQTNILALNAAVEAARAGEHGRGFAVVASEVRTLASRSSQAAKEIATLLSESESYAKEGTRLVSVTTKTMSSVGHSISRVAEIVSEIDTAATHQAKGIKLVNGAIVEIDMATQQNAALVEEAAAAAENLRDEADRLRNLTKAFQIESEPVLVRQRIEMPRHGVSVRSSTPAVLRAVAFK